MSELFQESVFFGVLLTFGSYKVGTLLKGRFHFALFNPLLVAIVLTISVLLVFDIPYEDYESGVKYLSYLMTPSTICLAVPLYAQMELLKRNARAVLAGVVAGVFSSGLSILAMAVLFGFDHRAYVTFLPKSITTAIGVGVSEELGGMVPVTVVLIVLTGVLGNVIAEWVLRVFRITEPIAKGIAIGSASHAMGTARAIEMGQVEGAMSSLSIVVSGLLTVLAAGLFASLW